MMAGDAVTMDITSCVAADTTFAVAHLDTGEANRIGAVKQVLRQALYINLSRPAPAPAPGDGELFIVDGTGPDGHPLRARSRIYNHENVVVQVTVVGRRLDADAVEFFFSSIKRP